LIDLTRTGLQTIHHVQVKDDIVIGCLATAVSIDAWKMLYDGYAGEFSKPSTISYPLLSMLHYELLVARYL